MLLKNALKRRNILIISIVLIAIFLILPIFNTYSEDITDSSWDGVVSRSFSGGTGTAKNPYLISSASDYAYFKEVLESEDASAYVNKNYKITKSFNYGEHDISINNTIPFEGSIDGLGNTIDNATVTNGLFNSLDGANIKNIKYSTLSITNNKNSGIISSETKSSDISLVIITGNVLENPDLEDEEETYSMAGISYSDESSSFKNIVLNVNVSETVNYYSVVGTVNETDLENILVLKGHDLTSDETELTGVIEFEKEQDELIIPEKALDNLKTDDYEIILDDNYFTIQETIVEEKEETVNPSGPSKAPSRSASISLHDSGISGDSIYINDLVADQNYYTGRNYIELDNTNGTIPDGNNQNLYTSSNLATVYIRYSGADINYPSVYGTVSVSETVSNYYYYKKFPVSEGYIEFDLIDNPWANRPNDMAFNGWVTDFTGAVISYDKDTYTRHVKIPVSDISSPISITFYSSWTVASLAETTGEISSELKSAQMHEVPGTYESVAGYYISDHIDRYDYYPTNTGGNLYTLAGARITATYCYTRNGCDFLRLTPSNVYNPRYDYYSVVPYGNNATVTRVYPAKLVAIDYYTTGDYVAGLFIRVTSGTNNIYSNTGEKLTTCGGSCYKLLQYSDGTVDNSQTYYYLATRDTNIFAPNSTSTITTGNISTSVPMTITGINNGTDNSDNRVIQLSNNWSISSDLRVEFITFYVNETSTTVDAFSSSGYKILGNFNNVKLGRGLKRYTTWNNEYLTATSFVGGNANDTSSLTKYKMIVESGFYQNGSATGYSSYDHHVQGTVILGSDYDRIDNNNDDLIVYYCYAGSWGSNLYSDSGTSNTYDVPSVYSIIKSGSYGTNKEDYAAGVYVGGRAGGTHYSLREILVEGGYIYNLIGGPASSSSRASKNDIIINVKGGNIDLVFGGAGATDTVGNKIINVTGGTINYSILGGSNANEYASNTTNPYGKIDGNTLLYVGGNVTVGTKNDTLFTVPSGDVYGAGNGRSGELDVGAVNNSHVIIGPSATITGSVYGGGNNGAVGGNTTGTYQLDGSGSGSGDTTSGGVYEDGTTDNNIRFYGSNPANYIQFNGENYRIIGLFNNVSTSSGDKNLIRVMRTTTSSNYQAWANSYISGGGYRHYSSYYVRNDNNATKSTIYNALNTTFYNNLSSTYRNYIQSVNWPLGAYDVTERTASQFYDIERGSTPGDNYSVTSYNFNIGLFYPSDYGFATNDSTCLASNLSAYGNNSDCTSDNWIKGIVTRSAWTMTPSTYYVTGNYNSRYYYHRYTLNSNGNLERNRIYNGGYSTYAAYPSFFLKDDVTISGGTGTASDPYIIGSSDDRLTDIIYELMHPSTIIPDEPDEPEIIVHEDSDYQNRTHIEIIGGTISGSVYGAGNNNGAGNNTKGSNGRVALSKIEIDMTGGSVAQAIYGGANSKGVVYGDVSINVENGSVGSVYGGGKGGYADANNPGTYVSCNVDVNIGSEDTTNLTVSGSVYGGSAYGSVNTTNQSDTTSSYGVNVTVSDGIVTGSVFGGGKGGTLENVSYTPKVVGPITVNIEGGDIGKVFGGNDLAGTHDKLNSIFLTGGTVDEVYGGGNQSSVTNTHVTLNGSTVTNLYGGSNTLGDVATTDVNIISGTVHNIYGGNNEGGTCGTTDVDITGTTSITGTVYGGGNAVDTTTTNIVLNSVSGSIPNVYGGGNSASVTTSNVTNNGVAVTNMFGGSNSSGTVTTANIIHNSGTVTTLYGGNNAGGATVSSKIDFKNGTATTIYGGGNQANGGTSEIIIRNGTVGTLFGGGNSAGLTSSDIHVIDGSLTNIYGGSNSSGTVTNTNILIDDTNNTVTAVFGGGNNAPVGNTSIEISDGSFTNIYGGGNLAPATGYTVVDINGGTTTGNVYGGGNQAGVYGTTTVTITNATVQGSAYAGGNGVTATVGGNTSITIDGSTVIGTPTSVPPHSGSVFGGGNQAYTGTEMSDVTTSVNIVGGTIYGNVYGGANTAVIYGNTNVNIGAQALTNSNLIKSDIYIKGHIFGGGEANASGSEIYDWYFISVTEGTNIIVDGSNYNNLTIGGSFYGGGNASSASGDSYLLIKNYGSRSNIKRNVSIQRVDYVTIDNSSILLKGAIDRANEYDTELFSVSRVKLFKIKNNTEVYFETGANLLERFESLDNNNNYASVTINTDTNTLSRTTDNRIYMYEGRNLNIAKDQQVTDYGEVKGMTFFGIFNYDNDNNVNNGIYNSSYAAGATLPWEGTFSRGSYVLGAHVANHNIKVDGFYSNFINEETQINEVDYINPTPESGRFYMWFIGENVIEYNVNLVASKYSTLGSVETSFLEFSKPNTSFQILTFDSSEIASGISLIDKNNIPRIAATENDANTKFGLSMESSNNGWLTTGKTSFYTREPSIGGTTYYEGENSNVVPTMLFYLYHSKNISLTQDLGTVRISVMAITKLSALSNEVKRLVINVNMSTAMFQTTEYEGAMTPGDKYELFASTANNITTKSKLSAYYGIYASNTNLYQTGYHRVLSSSYILPVGTKITMLDFVQGTPEYYYHVISQTDYNNAVAEYNLEGECSYAFSLFTKMGSKSNTSNYVDATKNALYYDGTDSSEEFVFIVDFGDTQINQNQLGNTLLIEMRDANEETIITVLGIQHSQLTYNLYANSDSQLDVTITPSDNPLYIGYDDIFDAVIGYESTTLNGVSITDTQYFDNKLGAQIYIKNSQGNVLSGTDLTGTYFMVDNTIYYPDINGYTHIKLANKVGNTEKWLIFNSDNSTLASGSYTFVVENFASPDGIYYSKGNPTVTNIPITIISSVYGLNPIMDDDSVIFSANNDKNLKFTINYTSLLENPNIRLALYRRKYDTVYDTNYELVDLQDYIDQQLFGTTNTNEYLLVDDPNAVNEFVLLMEDELLTGTYRLAFRLYDNDTMIGEIIRYIIVK